MTRSMNSEYHVPVLLRESIDGLIKSKDGIYVDLTYGGGGHSASILNSISTKGCLYSFDQDEEAIRNKIPDQRLRLFQSNFKYFGKFLDYERVNKVDGILADLGVSSHQFDSESRGFSFRFDHALDMRMNEQAEMSAADILNSFEESELVRVLSDYGEVRNTKTLARAIVASREVRSFDTTHQFNSFLRPLIIGEPKKYLSQVYQALRIEVNQEMKVLEQTLSEVSKYLVNGGRFVVLTYHSVEDRLVKRFLKSGNISGEVVKDDFGKIYRPFKKIGKAMMMPSAEEIKVNPRSRSAKLRIVEKMENE